MKKVFVSFDEILIDATQAAIMLDNACERGCNWKISSIVELSDKVMVLFEKNPHKYLCHYVFVQIDDENDDTVVADIETHFDFGFDLIGTFLIGDKKWGLFRKQEN